jgi:hypothetical protein
MVAHALAMVIRGIATLRFQYSFMEVGARAPIHPHCAAAVGSAVAEARRRCRGLAIVAGLQIPRRAHDLAGAGGEASRWRPRPCLPFLGFPCIPLESLRRLGPAT